MAPVEASTSKKVKRRKKNADLGYLRHHCEACQRQMLGAFAYKQHCSSELHVRKTRAVAKNPRVYEGAYSDAFCTTFVEHLRDKHGEEWTHAHDVYNEFTQSRQHVHMSATKFNRLAEFVQHLGKEGICQVREGKKGTKIALSDSSPQAAATTDTARKRKPKKERSLRQDPTSRANADTEEVHGPERPAAEPRSSTDNKTGSTSTFAKPKKMTDSKGEHLPNGDATSSTGHIVKRPRDDLESEPSKRVKRWERRP